MRPVAMSWERLKDRFSKFARKKRDPADVAASIAQAPQNVVNAPASPGGMPQPTTDVATPGPEPRPDATTSEAPQAFLAPQPPTARSSSPAPAASLPSASDVRGQLWNPAYDGLEEDDHKLSQASTAWSLRPTRQARALGDAFLGGC